MNRKPYSNYHGRKTLLQRILTGIAILLAVVLLLAVVALFALPNILVYNGEKIQVDWSWLPWLKESVTQTAQPMPDGEEPDFIIEEPGADTSDPPSAEVKVDLSFYTTREAPRGLVTLAPDQSPAQGQGAIFDMTGELMTLSADLSAGRADARELSASLPYAAAWLAPDWATALKDERFTERLIRRCLLLADCGYDEILLSEAVPEGDGADLAKLYRDVKSALDKAGWQGRLGLVLDQSLMSGYDEDLVPAIAQSFDRLYFRSGLRNNVRPALLEQGFSEDWNNIVTVVKGNPGANYSWAVLPQ